MEPDSYVDVLISGGDSIDWFNKEQLIKFHDGSEIAKALGVVWDQSTNHLYTRYS